MKQIETHARTHDQARISVVQPTPSLHSTPSFKTEPNGTDKINMIT